MEATHELPLKSERAIEMSVLVVLAFVRMRRAIAGNRHILTKPAELERWMKNHGADIQDLMDASRELMSPAEPSRTRFGFEAPQMRVVKLWKGAEFQFRENK
jgi:hypothetical protein